MGVEFDFSDVDSFFDEIENEVAQHTDKIGKEAVQHAKDNGSYSDQTGHLRESNTYKADKDGLRLENEAEYASFVEAKGFEVLSGAALHAQKKLNE